MHLSVYRSGFPIFFSSLGSNVDLGNGKPLVIIESIRAIRWTVLAEACDPEDPHDGTQAEMRR
jgi:hypothetical protein